MAITRSTGHVSAGDTGPMLAKAKNMLEYVLQELAMAQAEELVERARVCAHCGRRMATKDVERLRVHTLGRISFTATRVISCGSDGSMRTVVGPLRGRLNRCTDALRYQAARYGSEHSCRGVAEILQELLLVHLRFGHSRVRGAVLGPAPGWNKRPV